MQDSIITGEHEPQSPNGNGSNGLLGEYLTDEQLAAELDKSPRTIARWRRMGTGPPTTWIGRKPYTKRTTARQWLTTQERRRASSP